MEWTEVWRYTPLTTDLCEGSVLVRVHVNWWQRRGGVVGHWGRVGVVRGGWSLGALLVSKSKRQKVKKVKFLQGWHIFRGCSRDKRLGRENESRWALPNGFLEIHSLPHLRAPWHGGSWFRVEGLSRVETPRARPPLPQRCPAGKTLAGRGR